MAVVTKVRRLSNPHRKTRRRNPRRRMTAKQIKFFGTKRQKAGLKAARKRKRTMSHRPRRRANPVTRTVKRVHRTTHRARRRKKSVRCRTHNPALVLTLGAVNPHRKRRAKVAQKKHRRVKRHNPSRPRRRRRVVVSAPVHHRRRSRVSNPRRRHYSVGRRRIHNRRRRRNPELFGTSVTGMNTVKMVAGGLVGVAVCKFIPTMLPAQFISGPILRVVATGASAFLAGFVARKVGLSPQVAGAVLFGGLMQTGSVALNAFLPSSIATRLALSGMGDIVPGRFPVPQNPLLQPAAVPVNARTTVSGLDRSYGRSI